MQTSLKKYRAQYDGFAVTIQAESYQHAVNKLRSINCLFQELKEL